MNNIAVKIRYFEGRPYCPVPATGRGRAMHSVDWFMNGKPGRRNYDNANIAVADLVR